MRGIFAITIPVGLFLSIVFVEGGAILFGCTGFSVLPVLLFVIALLHRANIRLSALTSVLSKIPVRSDVAMTGEITLRGEVLKIGGLKEKLLAARRGGIKVVLIPEGNVRDLKEIPDNIKADLDIKPVKWIDEVLDIVLTRQPIPWEAEDDDDKVPSKKTKTKKSSIKAH